MPPANRRDWLEFCRRMRPELTREQFDALRPQFLRLYRKLRAAKRRREVQ